MYPSGSWAGFWQQEGWGRQPMQAFVLKFQNGVITGGGYDVIGHFKVFGEYEADGGAIRFVKHYFDAHSVLYSASPDGEGSVVGTWVIKTELSISKGSFALKPNFAPQIYDEPIQEIEPF